MATLSEPVLLKMSALAPMAVLDAPHNGVASVRLEGCKTDSRVAE